MTAPNKLAMTEAALKKCSVEAETLRDNVQELKRANWSLRTELEEIKKRDLQIEPLSADLAEAKKLVDVKDKEIEDLKKELEYVRKNWSKVTSDLLSTTAKLQKTTDELEEALKKNVELQGKLSIDPVEVDRKLKVFLDKHNYLEFCPRIVQRLRRARPEIQDLVLALGNIQLNSANVNAVLNKRITSAERFQADPEHKEIDESIRTRLKKHRSS